jgi:hypothetical protein
MSGSIAAGLIGVASIGTSLFGAFNQPVSLGDFIFQSFEVPESIKWGGQQSLAVHKLVGGQRVIDALGPDDDDIPWSGIFLSSDASNRADQLDQMRMAGVPLPLTFAGRSYDVVIRSFRADQRKQNHIPYSIVCTILNSNGPNPKEPTALSQVTDDINSALGFDISDALSQAQTTLNTVAPVLTPLVALVGGTAAATAVASGLGTAQGFVNAGADLANGQISGITNAASSVGNVIGAATAKDATANMTTAGTATATAAMAAAMGGYVGRALVNVGNA